MFHHYVFSNILKEYSRKEEELFKKISRIIKSKLEDIIEKGMEYVEMLLDKVKSFLEDRGIRFRYSIWKEPKKICIYYEIGSHYELLCKDYKT